MRALPLLMLSAAAMGADVHLIDTRAQGGFALADVASESTSVTTPAAGGPTTTSSTARSDHLIALREGFTVMRGRMGTYGGIVWGGGFAVSHYYYNSELGHTRIVNPVVDGYLNYGYAFAPWLHLEIGPIVGVGYSLFTEEPPGMRIDNRSHFYEYGVRLGVYCTFAQSWQAGVELPTMVGHSRPQYATTDAAGNYVATNQKNTFRTNGAMLSLGVRF